MKLKFLKARYNLEFKIPEEFTKVLHITFNLKKVKNKRLAVFSAIQFNDKLDIIKKIIENEGYEFITSKPRRTAELGQILGCDSYKDSLNLDLSKIDGFIYVGDGDFHPNALIFAQENERKRKPIISINVVQQIIKVIDDKNLEKYFRKRNGNLLKFHTSKIIGVYVTSKWGQEYMNSAMKLKKMYPEKDFYFFISDNFLEREMENFPYIECWVNTACPRIGQDDVIRQKKAVVNIKDIWKNKN